MPPVQIRTPRPKHLAYFPGLIKIPLHPIFHCGILPDRRPGFASRLISTTSLHAEFAETRVGRSAVLKLLNAGKLSSRHRNSMGKIRGTLRISRVINIRKCKSDSRARTRVFFDGVSKVCLVAIVQQEDTPPKPHSGAERA